jgi:glycosyltransferase involved in cell wall biosynthesis
MKKSLRILVAHNVPRQRTGGMSRIMGFVHDQLVRVGHSVYYFCAEDLPPSLNGPLARFTFPAMVLRRAMAEARRGRPFDVVNVHEPSGAAISILKRAAGAPRVVVTSHGVEKRGWELLLEESRLKRDHVRGRSRFIYPATVLWQARLALASSDHIFSLNLEDSEYLATTLRIPAGKITRIYPGADDAYAKLGEGRDYNRARTLLFAGTWLKRKGIADLVPAFSTLAARYPELLLVVLNGGVPESKVRACFPEEIRSRVLCRQAEPEQGTAEAMASADIYLLPSLFEGTPLTLMEAMFEGLPIVTTATCGMKDVIQHEKNGLLVPIRSPQEIVNAVERLLRDPDLRARLGQAARAEALQNYNWQKVAEPVCKVYERLCL